jgi:hypothetical protein
MFAPEGAGWLMSKALMTAGPNQDHADRSSLIHVR